LLTGVTIATYTSIDRVGAQLAPPWLYGAILWLVAAAGLLLVGWLRPRVAGGRFAVSGPLDVPRSVASGLLTLVTYLLVLFALSRSPVAVVGPLRESAVLLTSAYGVLVLHEAVTRREMSLRLAGSVLVVLGAALLVVGG
jgi:drug/metabolite transporter (DMT)-like permease